MPGFLLGFGVTLFLVNWTDFFLYALLGWGLPYLIASGAALLAAVAAGGQRALRAVWARGQSARGVGAALAAISRPSGWFLFLAALIALRFDSGIIITRSDGVWTNFNFTDTAFHLSVANAFANAPRFPPADLDVFPYPLKYHFMADFYLAHLGQLGMDQLAALCLMNMLGGLVLMGALWSAFDRWLGLPARWTALAIVIFLFLGTVIPNLVHYFAFRPPYFDPTHPIRGVVLFHYFNFESTLLNMLEPQRALVFSLPVALLVLHAAFGVAQSSAPEPNGDAARTRTWPAFVLVCLLPFAHIIAFAITAGCLLPRVWRDRRWLLSHWLWWLPVLVIGLLQLLYLADYGPPANSGFSGFDAPESMPLSVFAALPRPIQYVVFWLFADGDFLGWSLVFALPLLRRARNEGAASRLREFVVQWWWYFAVCTACFLWINFYRYSAEWGDSNKFVLFLNLGLTLVIVLGASRWIGRPAAWASRALWWFFFVLCMAAPLYEQANVLLDPRKGVLMFHPNAMSAAAWLQRVAKPDDVVLTAAHNRFHFVTPLAGQPTLAGIYSEANPYGEADTAKLIRQVYEQGDLAVLPKLGVEYVCVSRAERRRYRLSPKWTELMLSGRGVVFSIGEPLDHFSVFLFDAAQLAPPDPPGPAP